MMYKYLGYVYEGSSNEGGDPTSPQEALANEKTKTAKLDLAISDETCGDTKELRAYVLNLSGSINYFITIPKSQVDLAKTIGYEIYIEEGKWNYFPCAY